MIRIAIIGIVGQSVFLPVEQFHKGGETVVASDIHTEWGGKGYNQAIAAARHGARVSFLAAVGKKDAAAIQRDAAMRGIDPHLVESDICESSYAVIMTDRTGENRVTVYHGAALTARDVEGFSEEIIRSDLLLLSNEVSEEVNEEAVRIAKRNGIRVILNPAPSRPLSEKILAGVSLFTPNEHETEGLKDTAHTVVTLGGRGCLVRESDTLIPAARAGDAVDTTGAGDTFNGVLAVALAEGTPLMRACELANAAAAIKVTRSYVADAIPTRNQTYLVWEKSYG